MRPLVTFALSLGLVVFVVTALVSAKAETEIGAGHVRASCELLMTRPTPIVSDVDGTPLPGDPYISAPLGTGLCTSIFTVEGLPVRDAYLVRVGPMSTPGPVSRSVIGNVELAATYAK